MIQNQIKNLSYSSNVGQSKIKATINSWFLTGFVDGEGYFLVLVLKRARYKTGWNIIPVFTISLNSRDAALLEKIQQFFGGIGKISIRKKDNVVYFTVKSVKDLMNVIIPHFEKYPRHNSETSWFYFIKKNCWSNKL